MFKALTLCQIYFAEGLRVSNRVNIPIKVINTSQDISLALEPSETIANIKQNLGQKMDLPAGELRLFKVTGTYTEECEDSIVEAVWPDESSNDEEDELMAFAKAKRKATQRQLQKIQPELVRKDLTYEDTVYTVGDPLYLLLPNNRDGKESGIHPSSDHESKFGLQRVNTGRTIEKARAGEYIHQGMQGKVFKLKGGNEVYKIFNMGQGYQEELAVANKFLGQPGVLQATGYTRDSQQGITYELCDSDFDQATRKLDKEMLRANLERITVGVVTGLNSIHQKMWTHNDIKGANLMLKQGPGGVIDGLVGDLGCAKVRQDWTVQYPNNQSFFTENGSGPSADLFQLGESIYKLCMSVIQTVFGDLRKIDRNSHQPGMFASFNAPALEKRGVPRKVVVAIQYMVDWSIARSEFVYHFDLDAYFKTMERSAEELLDYLEDRISEEDLFAQAETPHPVTPYPMRVAGIA